MRGALSALGRRSIHNPAQPVTIPSRDATVQSLWGAPSAGDPMRVGAALRCVMLLASSVAGCPLRVTDRDTLKAIPSPLLSRDLDSGTPFELWESVVAHLATRGNAFLYKQRNGANKVTDLILLDPNTVTVKNANEDRIGAPIDKKFTVRGVEGYTDREILHIPGLAMDGLIGLSVVENLRRTFMLAEKAESVALGMYDRGLITDKVVSIPEQLSEERAGIVKRRLAAKMGGLDNAFDPLVLDGGAKIDHLTLSPSDAQFLETRQFSTTEIARIFGLPGWIINDQEKSTAWGSGMEQQFTAFVMLSLKPYMQRIEQRVTKELLTPGQKAEFKIEGLLRGDSKSRAAFYASGTLHGWLVPNDIRPLEGMPKVAWGEEPYRPYNHAAGEPLPGTEPTEDDDKGTTDDDDS